MRCNQLKCISATLAIFRHLAFMRIYCTILEQLSCFMNVALTGAGDLRFHLKKLNNDITMKPMRTL